MKVLMNLDRKIPVHPIEYYFRKGWKIVPVLAVDFSSNNPIITKAESITSTCLNMKICN